MKFVPPDKDFESRVRDSFNEQQSMKTLGARLTRIMPGEVRIEFEFHTALTQQHGFIHAGIATAVVDSACGYAAATLMPHNAEVLTVEFKVNFLSPAQGEKFLCIGRVIKPGRTLTVCSGEVIAHDNGTEKTVAVMQATMMALIK